LLTPELHLLLLDGRGPAARRVRDLGLDGDPAVTHKPALLLALGANHELDRSGVDALRARRADAALHAIAGNPEVARVGDRCPNRGRAVRLGLHLPQGEVAGRDDLSRRVDAEIDV